MLGEAHVRPLRDFAAALRAAGDTPDLDPLDGGVGADLLFLLEKPGPTTIAGSGFVSRDNDTMTAASIRRFMDEARIDRRRTLLWNAVPRWNGTMRITAAERRQGLATLPALLLLLPALRTVVLVGRTAAHARPLLDRFECVNSAHPSPQVRAAFPEQWRAIPLVWADAARRANVDFVGATLTQPSPARGRGLSTSRPPRRCNPNRAITPRPCVRPPP